MSREGRQYKEAVHVEWCKAGMPRIPAGAICSLSVTWYRKAQRGDLDNRLKAACDALQTLVYENDRQIVELHAFRMDDPKKPRIEVRIDTYYHIANNMSASEMADAVTLTLLDDYGAKEP